MIDIYLSSGVNDIDFISKKHKEFKTHVLDYEDISIMELFKKYFEISLFGDKNLYIVNNAKFLSNVSDKLKKKEEEVFLDILCKKSNNKIVFLINKELNKKLPYLKDKVEYYNYSENIQKESQKSFLKRYNINISESNLNYIIENIEETYNYYDELLKLSMFKNNEEILKEDIDNYVVLKASVNIFSFIEAVILNNKKKANDFYKKIKEKEDMTQEQILAIMHTQIKFFSQVKILRGKNISENEIAKILSCSFYRLKMSNNVLNKTDLKTLANLYEKVARYDYLIKSGMTKEKDVIINFLIN